MRLRAVWMALLLGISTGAQAQTSCSEDCASEIGCYGGCTINSPDCGTLCSSSGCKITCKEFGSTEACTASETLTCDKRSGGPPKTSRTGPAARVGKADLGQWALVGHPAPGHTPLKIEHIPVIAASSPEFGGYAAREMLRKLTENTDVRRRAAPGTRSPGPKDLPKGRLPELFLAPGTGDCVKPSAGLANKAFPFAVEDRVSAYIKGTTDGNGTMVALEVLYTRQPQWSEALVTYALDNLRVWAPEVPGVPLEFYGSLAVAKSQAVGYSIGGVFAPPGFLRDR